MNPIRYLILSLGLALTASAQPVVVVTNAILKDIVSQIAGSEVQLEQIVPNDSNPIEYELTDSDREKIAGSAVLIANGAGLEPWLDEVVTKLKYTGVVVEATEDVALLDQNGNKYVDEPAKPGADPIVPDPYAWQDPRVVDVYIENIRSALSTLMPTKTISFREQAAAYKIKLAEAHNYAIEQFAKIPIGARKLVMPFDCFNYFANAYGFSVYRIPGLASGQTIRPAVIDRLVDIISPLRPRAVFFERTANRNALRDIAGSLNVKADASLYAAYQLGVPGSGADTYLGMFRSNVDAITKALAETSTPAATDKAPAAAPAPAAATKAPAAK